MDATGNRRRSVDTAMATPTAQAPTLNRSRSFKTKQLVRSQAIRESASPPRIPSPRNPDRFREDNPDVNTKLSSSSVLVNDVDGTNVPSFSVSETSSQVDCDRAKCPNNPDLFSSQGHEVSSPVERAVEHQQVVIQVTSGDHCDLSPSLCKTSSQYNETKSLANADINNKARQLAKKWQMKQTNSSDVFEDTANKLCICGSCECSNTGRRRTQVPPCPSKQDSGVVCCSDDCPDCFYWRSVDMANNELESPVSDKADKQKQWPTGCAEYQKPSSDINTITSILEQKIQICKCQEIYDRNNAVKNRSNVSLTIQRTDSDESHCEPTGPDLARFIKETLNKNLKDRITLLKIERELVMFVSDPGRTRCQFPAMTSYGRMLVHRCAALFGLNHVVDNFTKTSVIVSKLGVPSYHIPCTPFKQWCTVAFPLGGPTQSLHQDSTSQAKSILKRDSHSLDEPMGPSMSAGPLGPNGPPARSKSFEQREEEYERVRRRIFSVEESQSQDPTEWSWPAGTVKLLTPDSNLRPSRLLKVQSLETDGGRSGNSGVSKSHSFGGYGAPPVSTSVVQVSGGHQPRLLSRQGDLASSSWRLSPSSSGYKTLSFRSTDSITPSPTGDHTPEPPQESSSTSNMDSSSTPSLVWAVSDMSAIPSGALIIHPQTGRPVMNSDGSLYRYDPARPPRIGDPPIGPRVCTPPELIGHQQQQDALSPEKRRGRLEKQNSIMVSPDCNEYHLASTEIIQKPCIVSADASCPGCQCHSPKDDVQPTDVYKCDTIVTDRSTSPFNDNNSIKKIDRCRDSSPLRNIVKDAYAQVKELEKQRSCDHESFCEECDATNSSKERYLSDGRQEACSCADCNRANRERPSYPEGPRENDTNLPLLTLPQLPRGTNQVFGLQNDLEEIIKQQMVVGPVDQYQPVAGQSAPIVAPAFCPSYSPPYHYCDQQSLTFTYAHHHRSHPVQYPVESVAPSVSPLVRGMSQPTAGGAFLVNQAITPYHQASGIWPSPWMMSNSTAPAAATGPPPPSPLYTSLTPVHAPSQPANVLPKHHSLHGIYVQQSDYGIVPNAYTGVTPPQQLYQTTPNMMTVPNPYAIHNTYGAHMLAAGGHQPYSIYPGYPYSQTLIAQSTSADGRSSAPLGGYEQTMTPTMLLRKDFENLTTVDDARSKINPSNSGSVPSTPRIAHASPISSYILPNQQPYPSQEGYSKPTHYFQFPSNNTRVPEYPSEEARHDSTENTTGKQISTSNEDCQNHYTHLPPPRIDHQEQTVIYYHTNLPVQNSTEKPVENSTDDSQQPIEEESSVKNVTSNLNAECKNFVPKSSSSSDSAQSEAAKDLVRNLKRLQDRQNNPRMAPNGVKNNSRPNYDRRGPDQRDYRTNAYGQSSNSPISTSASINPNQLTQMAASNSSSPPTDTARRPTQSPRFNRSRTFDGDQRNNGADSMRRNNTPPNRQGLIPLNPRIFGDNGPAYSSPQYGPGFRTRPPHHSSLVAQQMQAMGLYPRPAFVFARQMSANSPMWNRRPSDANNQGANPQIYRQTRGQRPQMEVHQQPSNGQRGPHGQYGRQGNGYNHRR